MGLEQLFRLSESVLLVLALLISTQHPIVLCLNNGLALTPAMGWNTWNRYGCEISEDIIIQSVRAMKKIGLDKIGYQYINIDDCWQAPSRGLKKEPIADPIKFPRGIKYLADEIHSLGFKLGIYSDAGTYTCGKRFGSLGFEEIDAKTYAEWGVDYLKYDNCYNEGQSGTPDLSASRYRRMRDALNSTGRPILYSMCSWGEDAVWNWASTIANSWRISGDITDNFDRYDDRCPCEGSVQPCLLAGYYCSVTNILEKSAGIGQKAGRGGWNDLDNLEVGNGGMTHDEYVTHFSMWALLKSPLILGNDVTSFSPESLSIITNQGIIALNQDPANSAGYRVWKRPDPNGGSNGSGGIQLWRADLVNGSFALAFLNLTPRKVTHSIDLAEFFNGVRDDSQTLLMKKSLRFGFDEVEFVSQSDSIEFREVPIHGIRVLRLNRINY
ncbi:family 27 glycoside hydrolase [Phakopsora pachyrhizi]|uniref:Alpha-galactosidase n=1 Tax=Phakopsora pachyrhizi TaxID=170000 RepID=A0AAV0BK67_PHAPC|nr:family 27 glycoside hydrolase [Phakopsora pachyrhizi]